ncbi:hypothetical protein AXX17_AT1G37000 [Arabidopsis thaliana]|uniref:Uncharacterized protein n=1 Tax=Arabidopsis thaliana TaxID=3702 RepID=A0A178WNQ2_ARATH|nr:hypothetical protein AXX17_AT1G37000 [Arabidopsis thaliana]
MVDELWDELSLIARPLNLCSQNLNVVIAALPRSWGLTSRVYERVLYTTFVQFLFQSENPPRVAAPSLNHEELVAAYFPHARAASLPNNAVMDHQTSSSRQLVSRNSNIQLFSGNVIASNAPRLVEIGESSRKVEIGEFVNMMEKGDSTKRKNMGGVRDKEDERKHRGFEHKDGVILKPPKKR